jgi:hypothetical protein
MRNETRMKLQQRITYKPILTIQAMKSRSGGPLLVGGSLHYESTG